MLADLARRDLVPAVWVPSLDDRAIRERLRRRAHLIRLRTSAINRTFGLPDPVGPAAQHHRAAQARRASTSSPSTASREVWLQSIRTLLGVIDDLDRQLAPLERELRPLARARRTRQAADDHPRRRRTARRSRSPPRSATSPASRSARKLVGYSGLTREIKQSGQSSRIGRLSKAGPATLRWAAVEASQQAWRPTNPWHALYTDIKRRHGKANPAKAAVARKVLIAAWHVLSPQRAVQAQRPARHRSCPGKLLHSSGRLTAHKRSEKPGQLQSDHVRRRAPKENSAAAVTRNAEEAEPTSTAA